MVITKGSGHSRVIGGHFPDAEKSSPSYEPIGRIFRALEAAMGPQHWWPAGSAFEVVVGAYLTQNTAWTKRGAGDGEPARRGVLSVAGNPRGGAGRVGGAGASGRVLPAEGRPAEKSLWRSWMPADEGSLEAMFAQPVEALRQELLGLTGVGPETADSILLYAASREVFVVDAYTRRIFERHSAGSRRHRLRGDPRAAVETALMDCDAEAEPTPGADRPGLLTEKLCCQYIPLRRLPPWHAASLPSATTSSTPCWCRPPNTTA